MHDARAMRSHFGWFKRRRQLQLDDVTVVDRGMLRKAVGAAALGNAMEWFDFGVYGYLAVTLGRVFFPASNPTAQLIATFATFTVAFLVRPIGGMVFGSLGDYIAGAATVTVLHMSVTPAQMLDWGGRVPFLIAGPLGLLGLYMRMKLEETPAFRAYTEQSEQRERQTAGQGLMTLLRLDWPQLLKCMGLVLVFNVTDYMLLTYMPSYLSVTMGYAENKGLLLIILVMLVMLVMMPLNIVGGMFSDKLGRRPMIIGACIALFALAIPCLLLIGSGNDGLIFAGLMLLGLALVCFTSSMPSTLPALFYTPVRYSALSIGFNVSVSLFGGTTPLVTAWLVERTGDPLMPAYYLMGAAAIGLLTMLFVRETAGLPLRGSPPAVASDAEARALLQADSPVTVDAQLPVNTASSMGQPRTA
ncbi:MFS transporter [Xanthomonas oryzae]|uniref:MFS transporter n=1 Tax=Xanthomonas oryzae TaxID=347 RepID=UPI000642EE81|nr:MFS transporter [Xanthomonas oryzae]AKK62480.1 MFS transporter [Xanthomonas oryzae pv. oryzicola]AKO02370.1 MFS transporter [Xanthomonas oryzae pv. oryzicola]KOR54739.1 MFS transporter [Xanthomonas oryzae]MEC5080335.1 MFS transporter [Xanthomonas oryzae pv. oryzicola]MEC5114938.1 MFS transporter [Xanthomonas oryzae pv. oryzicola]